MCGFEKHGVTQGPSKAVVGKMTQGGIASRCGLLSSETFLKYIKPSIVLHAVFYITVSNLQRW